MSEKILIVDDEEQALLACQVSLTSAGFKEQILICPDPREVSGILRAEQIGVVVLDLRMPYLDGRQVLENINAECPDVPVIIATAVEEVSSAVECMRLGAFDYLTKPITRERLSTTVTKAVEHRAVLRENHILRSHLFSPDLKQPHHFAHILTECAQMKAVLKYAEAVAQSTYPVLILGETGTGKELLARGIHNSSGRTGPLVPVNIAGLDDTMVSDALFGHVRGAFTGAESARNGFIVTAEEGTLFLDEIGDLGPEAQTKLLRFLQEKTFYPLGSDEPKRSDVRIIAATNRDLGQLRDSGAFRADLYYRLTTHQMSIPPLRERIADIPMLVDHFLRTTALRQRKRVPRVPKEVFQVLGMYSFPGNVRELEAIIADAVSISQSGHLSLATFEQRTGFMRKDNGPSRQENHEGQPFTWPAELPTLRELETKLIDEALRRADGNQTLAAKILGVSRQTLNSRLMRMKQH